MAASMTSNQAAQPLRQKNRQAVLKRERRKRKRQALAKLREAGQEQQVDGHCDEEEDDGDGDGEEEQQSEILHQEWLERERLAQEEFRLKREKEAAAQKRKEEEERKIREEWEEQQRKEKEEKERKQQEKKDREEAAQKILDQAESQLENDGPWRNPDNPENYGTEKDRANCPFFFKTGACRFGDRCSRKHVHPVVSSTLMIRGMFVTFGMSQSRRDDYDTDASLEYSEEEVHQQFHDFYEDVLPEFKSVGKVVQFKVSCNYEPHLRGNVYVQYEIEDQCREAFMMFNGRWYAGRQLQCEFSPVTRWKTAICGLFDRQKCPKGKHCNFLHVFRNPGREFWEADRDLHLSPERSGSFSGRYSERRSRYSPDRSQRRRSERQSHSQERRIRNREGRSHSRERWSSNRGGQSPSKSRERSQNSWRSKYSSQSERPRRSRERYRSRSRSKDRQRRNGRGSSPVEPQGKTSRRASPASPKNESSKKRRRSESSSPCQSEKQDGTLRHRKKHSKKSKKKKGKKKHKRKRSKSCSKSSSADSVKDSEGEGLKVESPIHVGHEMNVEHSREDVTGIELHTLSQQCQSDGMNQTEKPTVTTV